MMRARDSVRRISDPRSLVMAAAAILICATGLLAGCRADVPLTDLQRMQTSFRALPESEREPALRKFLEETDSQRHYALYELGNIYYERAGAVLSEPGSDPRERPALLDSALTFFSAAVRRDSTFVEAWVNQGSVWEDLAGTPGRSFKEVREKAGECYRRAIELRPEDEKARCNLGALFYSQRLYEEALAEFRAVLQYDPDSPLAHYNMAILFAETKLYAEAIREWEAAAKNDPEGDVGIRSRENIRIIKDMMEAEIPEQLRDSQGATGRS